MEALMGVFGVDVSNHQSSFNFSGWDFAFIKSSEGNSFRDFRFNQHLTNARANNCLVAAYHYQRDVSAQSHVDLIKEMVPQNVPVIIDVERGSGSLALTREIIRLLREEGYDSPFLYLPRWYWVEIGRPDLSGLPRLWASWYPDYVARPREVGIGLVPQSAWSDYGNNSVAMMQFTSTPHDMNWYPGTRDDLARVLNGGTGGGGIGEDEVSWTELLTNSEGKTFQAGQYQTYTNEYVIETLNKVKELETKIDNIAVGEIDYNRLAAAVANMIFERLDVDIVRKGES
jgi:lysozyme